MKARLTTRYPFAKLTSCAQQVSDLVSKLLGEATSAIGCPSFEVVDGELPGKWSSRRDNEVFEDLRRHLGMAIRVPVGERMKG